MTKMSSSISSRERAIQNFLFSFFTLHGVSNNPRSRSDFGAGLLLSSPPPSWNSLLMVAWWWFREGLVPISSGPWGEARACEGAGSMASARYRLCRHVWLRNGVVENERERVKKLCSLRWRKECGMVWILRFATIQNPYNFLIYCF